MRLSLPFLKNKKLVALGILLIVGIAVFSSSTKADDDTFVPIPPDDDTKEKPIIPSPTPSPSPTKPFPTTTTTPKPSVSGYIGLRVKAYDREGVAWPITLKKSPLSIFIDYPTGRKIEATKFEFYHVVKINDAPSPVAVTVESMKVQLIVNGATYTLGSRNSPVTVTVNPDKYVEIWSAKVTVYAARMETYLKTAMPKGGTAVIRVQSVVRVRASGYDKTFKYKADIQVYYNPSGGDFRPLGLMDVSLTPIP